MNPRNMERKFGSKLGYRIVLIMSKLVDSMGKSLNNFKIWMKGIWHFPNVNILNLYRNSIVRTPWQEDWHHLKIIKATKIHPIIVKVPRTTICKLGYFIGYCLGFRASLTSLIQVLLIKMQQHLPNWQPKSMFNIPQFKVQTNESKIYAKKIRIKVRLLNNSYYVKVGRFNAKIIKQLQILDERDLRIFMNKLHLCYNSIVGMPWQED